MEIFYADEELKNYSLIQDIGFEEYYLGQPKKCNISTDCFEEVKEKCVEPIEQANNIDDVTVLTQTKGGDNIFSFFYDENNKKKNLSNDEIKKFLIGALKILKGIKVLLENDLVHYDIKSDNFLYTIRNNNMDIRFIDFGEIINIKKVNEEDNEEVIVENILNTTSKQNSYNNISPFETGLIKIVYEKIIKNKKINYDEKEKLSSVTYKILSAAENNRIIFLNRALEAIYGSNYIEKEEEIRENIKLVFNTNTKEELIKLKIDSLKSTDLFSAGIMFLDLLDGYNKLEGYEEFNFLFNKMCHPFLKKRISIDNAIKEYANILRTHNYYDNNNGGKKTRPKKRKTTKRSFKKNVKKTLKKTFHV
jgi:serine/threonine protein kinase